ncbi:MAG: stage II sporulation protein D [Clostridiales bacterium]|nr:stage II sporulation protein D [Clostridiales bacterium]
MKRSRSLLKLMLIYLTVFVFFFAVLPSIFITAGRKPPYELPASPEIAVLLKSGEVALMPIEEFLVGVVAAEMPASFDEEALKAQAIAARTYILNCSAKGNRHGDAVVCSSASHCQGFLDLEQMQINWGGNAGLYIEKIKRAVGETAGLVLTYDGVLIDALYHSTCGGRTEKASDYWTADLPYLQSVPCSWDAESPRYRNTTPMPLSRAAELLGVQAADLAGMNTSGLTAGGRPRWLTVGQTTLSCKEVREKLGLFSANFTWEISGQNITWFCSGSGHGVGLCQYGANGMAKRGYKAAQILTHYYTGVKTEKYY